MSRSRNRLSSKCACIKACITFYNHAIYRNSLARIYNYYRTNFYVIWIFFSNSSILMHYICNLRTYIHQIRYILTALSNRYTLEKLSYLIEKHYRNAFTILASSYSSYSCNRHKKAFIKHLTVTNIFRCLKEYIVSYYEIGYKKCRKFNEPRHLDKVKCNR